MQGTVSNRKRTALSYGPALASAVALLSAVAYVTAPLRQGTPVLASKSVTALASPVYVSGTWYWVQQKSDHHCSLVKLTGGQPSEVAHDEVITGISATSAHIAYIGGAANQLQLKIVEASVPRVLCAAAAPGRTVIVDGDYVYWTESVAPQVPAAAGVPAFSGHTDIKRVPVSGGNPAVIGTVLETGEVTLAGVSRGRLVMVCHRHTLKGMTSIYALPVNGGEPVRLAGASGLQSAAVTPDGAIWCSSAGRAASNPALVSCSKRVGADGHLTQFSDWLPANGTLFTAGNRVAYLDGTTYPALWRPEDARSLPTKVAIPAGFVVLAAGGTDGLDLLLRPEESTPASCAVFQLKVAQ